MAALALATTAALTLGACADAGAEAPAEGGVDAATATSLADFGSFEALEEAAKAEGQLNVIALPRDWANYGEVLDLFAEKYPEITINEASPDASSAEEIQAAENLKGQDTAPDVFDLGLAVALASTDYFAPYKVERWDDIPDALKEANGLFYADYGGYMAVGYDPDAVPAPTSLQDLLGADYRGKVAINGDP
ncbi:MAG: ABC transporter substrate-binding protein, partial [Microcella sp.]|nr:ABC transporter substrate-binding protein [Microcella sp.]